MALTRREFLKIMGAGAGVSLFGGLALFSKKRDTSNLAEGQSAGSWVSGPDTSTVAIHAAVLPSGKIFYFAGSGYHSSHVSGPFEARLFNPETGSENNVAMSEDLFCAGHAPLPNGNVLIADGTRRFAFTTTASRFAQIFF